MIHICGWMGKINNLDELADIQDAIIKDKPCIAFLDITYPQGNRACFFAVAEGEYYQSVSIGVPMYEAIMRGMHSDSQPRLDS